MRLNDSYIQQQQLFTLVNPERPTCCEAVSRDKGKDTIGDNEGSASECLSMETPWNVDTICNQATGQPQCQVPSFHQTPNTHAPTTTASSGNVTKRGIHEETSCTSTVEDTEMEEFYASLDTADSLAVSPFCDTKVFPELAKTRPSEETRKALQTLQHFFSEEFSISLHHGHQGTMKTALDHLSKLSAYDGVPEEIMSLILQVSREFSCWSRNYNEARNKIKLTNAKIVKVDELEERLGVNKKNFDQLIFAEKELLYQLAYLEERKMELEDQINDIKDSIFESLSAKDLVGKRKREIFDTAKTLKAQRDELRRQLPYLGDERENATQIREKIRAEWYELGEQFNKSMNEFLGLCRVRCIWVLPNTTPTPRTIVIGSKET
ncbi:hypothetical protein L6164_006277 [Bauhinia variegata]|uniref:Uncharacterized protein n=2 Tax=Bauhinia variegata TaxID=167791 RepID=A0ACB9PZC4_BAUVA|nr:hypothetical protein L6164_006277 [Bauhinia variegata]